MIELKHQETPVKMYKVLKVNSDGNVVSPFQGFNYRNVSEINGKEFICQDFNESNEGCANGYYATEIEGLIYSLNSTKQNRVFEVEMSGKNVRLNEYKHRFEKQKIVRMLGVDEVKSLVKTQSDAMEWNLYNIAFPKNPLEVEAGEVTKDILKLLKECAVVRASIWTSVGTSVQASVGGRVRGRVEASVWDSVWGYIGANFPNIKKWNHINHEEGIYPFQCYVDLQEKGIVPSFDGIAWRLHTGIKAEIIYTVMQEDLLAMNFS